MIRHLALLNLIVLGTVVTITAQAQSTLNFYFSFTGNPSEYGQSSGTVTGEIFGLTDNATSSATDVVIDSFPSGINILGVSAPLDATTWDVQYENSFTVVSGEITSASFASYDAAIAKQLGICGYSGGAYNYLELSPENVIWVGNLDGMSGVTFTPAPVPEPSSLALSALGGFGGFLMYRRRK